MREDPEVRAYRLRRHRHEQAMARRRKQERAFFGEDWWRETRRLCMAMQRCGRAAGERMRLEARKAVLEWQRRQAETGGGLHDR